ncbi:MAG: aminotransferase class V-fold PLP-dependent enzyme [Phycisphaerales bacterium]|nr:aminotransferase class V-fold PLP-dependent enzyme [Phycisphaerales bacterium]
MATNASRPPSVAGNPEVFPILETGVFLDHAAVAPLPRPVADAMRRFVDDWSQRGPQPWAYARIVALKEAAARLAGAASRDEVAIMPNTSSGLATVALGLDLGQGDTVVTTAIEFPSNRYVWDDRVRAGVRLVAVPPADGGCLMRDEDIVRAMREAFPSTRGTRLLAISHVQFSTGQRHDLAQLADEAHRLGGLVCVDAIQSLGQVPFRMREWGIDFVSADGHKWMLGPEGTGVLIVCHEHFERLRPPIVGWLNTANAMDYDRYDRSFAETARRYEPGAHAMVGVVGMAAALELLLEEGLDRIEPQVEALAGRLADGVRSAGVAVASPHDPGRGSGIVAIRPPAGIDLQAWFAAIQEHGVRGAVRRGFLRLSPHFYNTAEQIDQAIAGVAAARARMA